LSLDRATRPLAGAGSSQAAVPPSGRDYTLVEVKLFTAPPGDPTKVARRHLRDGALREYFKVRHLVGLLGFSYLHAAGVREPAVSSDPALAGVRPLHLWAIHLALCSREVLEEFPDAPSRADALFGAIGGHQSELSARCHLPRGYLYSLTYNIMKVIHMTQTIKDLRHEISTLVEEKRRAEEEKRRAEEEKRRAEEEKRRAEEERDRYRDKLRELGYSAEDL
ncbi:MAG: hypothetical protein ACTSU5_13080, partial [Promethearchaeota archaeon]